MFDKKKIRLPNGVRVKISRHFYYGFFGVRGRYDTVSHTGVYVNNKQPGTGFFVHDMDSRSYRHFVRGEKKKLEQGFLTMLLGREPSFAREIKRTEKALDSQQLGTVQKQVLAQYLNVLYLAQEEERAQRIVRGLKDKIGHRRTEKANYYTSILTNYKGRIATLGHDVRGTQLNIKEMMSEESLAAWGKVVEAFRELVEVRRLWHVVDDESYEQVFFDLGIFDYIQSPYDTPMMRDSQGLLYFFYPQGVIRYRSNVDFDFIPLNDISFTGGAVDLSTLSSTEMAHRKGRGRTDALGQLYATTTRGVNTVGQLSCPALGLTFCCNHIKPVKHFVEAFEEFKKVDKPLDFSLLGGGTRARRKAKEEIEFHETETLKAKTHL